MSLQHKFMMRRTANDLHFQSTESVESRDDVCLVHAKRTALQVVKMYACVTAGDETLQELKL
jgi:hypothetical protein